MFEFFRTFQYESIGSIFLFKFSIDFFGSFAGDAADMSLGEGTYFFNEVVDIDAVFLEDCTI